MDTLAPDTSLEVWRRAVQGALKGASWETLRSRSIEGLPIEPVYPRREGVAPLLGARGAARWSVAQRVDHPEPGEAARLALLDLQNGADALTLVFAGGRMARGYGLNCDTVDALDAALEGVDLAAIRLRLERTPAGRRQAALVADLVDRRKLSPDMLQLSFGLDPVGNAVETGSLAADGGAAEAETVRTLAARGFLGPFLLVDGRPWHEAGAGEAQELAAILATVVCYLRMLERPGFDLADARAALDVIVPLDTDELIGLAKLRALRRLMTALDQSCGLPATPLRLAAETSWRTLTRGDPHTNLLRGTVAAFTAALGGADALTVLPFTSALGLPDAFARRLARNTQAILLDEANLWRVADPLAGSGAIESLTDQLSDEAWSGFQQIEREGGMLRSLETGALQARVAATRDARRARIASGAQAIIGTTLYPPAAPIPVETLPVAQAPSGPRDDVEAKRTAIEPFIFLRDDEGEMPG